MKGYDIFKAMGDTEEKYLDMSESRPAAKSSPRVIKIAFAAAAAAALTVGIGAYTYSQFNNPESVEMYLENTDKVEASGNVVNQVMENGHLRITVDTVLSDGYNALVVVTLDVLDDEGENYLSDYGFADIMLRRTDTGDPVFPTGGGLIYNLAEQVRNGTVRSYHSVCLTDKDISCDYEIIFHIGGDVGWHETDENHIPIDNPLGYDFVARVSFEKNVETVKLTGTDNVKLTLSQFEVIAEHEDAELMDRDTAMNFDSLVDKYNVTLIKNDGTREKHEMTFGSTFGRYSTFFFGKFIDLEEYRGVEIDGVEYLKA